MVSRPHHLPARLQKPIIEYFPQRYILLTLGLWDGVQRVVVPKRCGRKPDTLGGRWEPFAAVKIKDL